uniref:Uncharacterized protein n=1 Tax=Romanomermis culicivorax TaxID=13658 RepID=A0A915HW52_ROMCU
MIAGTNIGLRIVTKRKKIKVTPLILSINYQDSCGTWRLLKQELSRGHRYERIPKSDRSEFTEPHSKPWMAVLLSKLDNDREDYAPCGAALISRPPYTFEKVENGSSDILITAAHCVVR